LRRRGEFESTEGPPATITRAVAFSRHVPTGATPPPELGVPGTDLKGLGTERTNTIGTMPGGSSFSFSVELGDILTFEADLVAFKYAQAFYGADLDAMHELSDHGALEPGDWRLAVGEHRFIDTGGALGAPEVLFVGMEPLGRLDYKSIRSFAASVIEALSGRTKQVHRLAMTVHGPGFGLDEIEAFFAQFAGCNEALARLVPPGLTSVVFVEISEQRVERLTTALEAGLRTFGGYDVRSGDVGVWDIEVATSPGDDQTIALPPSALPGMESEAKPNVFVAMPFDEAWDDVFYLGIQETSRQCGFVCERVDQEAFTGEVLEQVKRRIESADIVIAELSGANPNVYLEVGYAWGCGRPTILLLKGGHKPKFDVQGQKHLKYTRIMDLKDILATELEGLRAAGELGGLGQPASKR
jgi:hypothetical protein